MTNEEKFWSRFGGMIRKTKGDCPLTPAEAQKELDALNVSEQISLTKDEIECSVEKILNNDFKPRAAEPDLGWVEGYSAEAVDEDVYALNRNLGEADPEIDAKIEELRKKASNEEDIDKQDETGLGDREKPTGKGS